MEKYSSGLSGKAGLVEETLLSLQLIAEGYSADDLKTAIINNDILGKSTHGTRKAVYEKVYQRYLSNLATGEQLAKVVTSASNSIEKKQYIYYELCKSEPILYDAIIGPVWDRFENGYSSIEISNLQVWLDGRSNIHPEILEWSPQTRKKLLSNIITVLRDFGLMSGKTRKVFEPVYLPLNVFGYVLYRLNETLTIIGPQSIIKHPDWRLFLQDEDDVLALLDDASAAGFCTFKRQGSVMMLNLLWPDLGGYVEAITGEI